MKKRLPFSLRFMFDRFVVLQFKSNYNSWKVTGDRNRFYRFRCKKLLRVNEKVSLFFCSCPERVQIDNKWNVIYFETNLKQTEVEQMFGHFNVNLSITKKSRDFFVSIALSGNSNKTNMITQKNINNWPTDFFHNLFFLVHFELSFDHIR